MAFFDGPRAVLTPGHCRAIREAVMALVAEAYDAGGQPDDDLAQAAWAISQCAGSDSRPILSDCVRSRALDADGAEDWVWTAEAARIAGMSQRRISGHCMAGTVEARRIGGRWQTTRRAAQAMRRPA